MTNTDQSWSQADIDWFEELNRKRFPLLDGGKKYPHKTIGGKGLVARLVEKRKKNT